MDTSAIVRLYLDDTGAEEVRAHAAAAVSIATVRTAYAEFVASLGTALREGRLSASAHANAMAAFQADWPRYVVVSVTQGVVEAAASLSERYDLRPADALHIAAALALASRMPYPVAFLASDLRLSAAATAQGLSLAADMHGAGPAAPHTGTSWSQILLSESRPVE